MPSGMRKTLGCIPRFAGRPTTLNRDGCCIDRQRSYLPVSEADRAAPPSPDTPVARPDKPVLRQQLENPKRRNCLGFFFAAQQIVQPRASALHQIAEQT